MCIYIEYRQMKKRLFRKPSGETCNEEHLERAEARNHLVELYRAGLLDYIKDFSVNIFVIIYTKPGLLKQY